MFSSVTMLQRTWSSKRLPCLARFISRSRVNGFSDSAAAKNDDGTSNETDDGQNKTAAPSDVETSSSREEEVASLLKGATTYIDAKDPNWSTTPYPTGVLSDKPVKPAINPAETSVVLFPGQGVIKVGSVKKYLKFPNARELFEIANEVLNYNILEICLNGPQEKLNQTRYNQPATVVASLAALEQLREERPQVYDTCKAVAGYSIGELTALIFSGAFTFEDGIRLVSVRGAAMQYASDKSPQGMLSVYCTPVAKVHEACQDAQKWARDSGVDDPVCQIAIYLCTQSKILAGNIKALEYIEKNAKKYGLTKLSRLPVSGAFHTKLMEPALKSFYKMLKTLETHELRCLVYSNYNGHPYYNENAVKKYLPKQIVSAVKWEQCMQSVYNRPPEVEFPRTFDVGSQGKMKTILKLINAKAHQKCIAV